MALVPRRRGRNSSVRCRSNATNWSEGFIVTWLINIHSGIQFKNLSSAFVFGRTSTRPSTMEDRESIDKTQALDGLSEASLKSTGEIGLEMKCMIERKTYGKLPSTRQVCEE